MSAELSTIIRRHLGWCPHSPVLHTAPAVIAAHPETVHPAAPGSSRGTGGPWRIRHGIGIATGSIKSLFREKRLLWFSLLAGLVILFMVVAEGWNVTHSGSILSSIIWIPFGDSALIVFDLRLFLIEAICLSCFTLLLAGLVLYRNGSNAKTPVTIREGFTGVNAHAGTLAALSIAMAFVATVLFELASQSQVIGKAELAISLTLFHIPYAYYVPDEVFMALYFSFEIMVINFVLFLLALYVVPGIVLGNKGLLPVFAGSVALMKKTWREILGCMLVFGIIILGVTVIALLIGQSALLLNHDYDFFLQMSRGQVLMTVVCYGFLLSCGVLMAVGLTVLGVAITGLYACGTGTIPTIVPGQTPAVQPTQ